jgi:hypothetical protein
MEREYLLQTIDQTYVCDLNKAECSELKSFLLLNFLDWKLRCIVDSMRKFSDVEVLVVYQRVHKLIFRAASHGQLQIFMDTFVPRAKD